MASSADVICPSCYSAQRVVVLGDDGPRMATCATCGGYGFVHQRPRIVCLCGSTRFRDAWIKAYREESLAGRIVLSVGVMVHAGEEPISDTSPEKAMLDELHLRKIDLADEILVLNVDGYVGASTTRELQYAIDHHKVIRMLEARPSTRT